MRKRKRNHSLAARAAAILTVFGVAAGGAALLPWAAPALKNMAVAAAMAARPQQAIELLEKRFYSQLYPRAEEEKPKEEREEAEKAPEENTPQKPREEPKKEAEAPDSQEGPGETPPEIPPEHQGPVIEENMWVDREREGMVAYGKGMIRNSSNLTDSQVREILSQPDGLLLPSQEGPQVLIVHTHATESFEAFDRGIYDRRSAWRSTDNEENMAAVGEKVAQGLRRWGIEVIHDTTQHDYPSYNGSYERSAETIRRYLEKYPSIRVVLDVHRDAIQREETLVKPVTEINGEKVAQLMIIAGCDDGTMNMPNWRENLRFAAGLQNQMESLYPGLTRPVFFCYRKYNMDLTTGSLLIEFGSHGNTLEEVLRTGELAGDAIGQYLAGKVGAKKG